MKPTNQLSVMEMKSFWENHYEQYKKSQLSKANYAKKHDLIKHRLIYWFRKIEKSSNNTPSAEPEFIPITINEELSSQVNSTAILCTLELPAGKRLLVHNEAALKLCLNHWR